MCGIVGVISDNISKYSDIFSKMLKKIYHRGPDEQKTLFLNGCILGHSRLSIIDLSTGTQPMKSSKSDKYIIFNGEIYGYKKIMEDVKNDYIFKTTSDTEVILALYEKYYLDCLKYLPGMFSFAIWDNEKRELFAARDRFGEKPFFYAINDQGDLIFASEIKAILESNSFTPILDFSSLTHYLTHLYVQPNKTIYKNIYTLPPAHFLTYKNKVIKVERYWNIPVENKINLSDALDNFKFLFEKSVSNQLVADVPVGAFLSGGLDSSTVVAVASKYKPKIQTFSFGFEDGVSELPYAQQIAKMYNTDHHELTAENVDIADLLLKMNEIYDEPFADSSNIPTYLISKLSSEKLKVILTGDGADELFGGYWWWYYQLLDINKNNKRNIFDNLFLLFIDLIFKIFKVKNPAMVNKELARYYISKNYNSFIEAYKNHNRYFLDKEIKKIVKREFFLDYLPQSYSFKETNSLNDALYMDIENYMPGDILVKTDRASMANSLELRAPFLDVDFAGFCLSLPANLKIDENRDKIILREAYSKLWSQDIQKRGKQGFGAPVKKWLLRKKVHNLKIEYLHNKNKKIFNFLDYNLVNNYSKLNNYQTWVLLVLSIWMEKNNFNIK